MFRGLRRRLRGNHERRVRHSVFTQLRRVSIPPRAPQLNCSTKKCAIGSHVRLHAPRSLNAPQRPSTLLATRPAHRTRRSARRKKTPDGRSWCRTARTRFPVRSSAAPCQLPPPHPPPPPPPPQDDPPPQDEPPPQEEPPVEQPPPPPEPEPEPEPEPPAHQLCLDRRERLALLRLAPDTTARTATAMNATRMMPPIMAPPSFRSPEAAPVGSASRRCFCLCFCLFLWLYFLLFFLLLSRVCFLCERGMPPRLTDQSRVEQLQRLSAG